MALTQLTKVDGRGINTTSDYRVGILTAIKFVGPFDGTGGNFAGVVTATDGVFSGNVTIGGTLTYEDVTNIDSVGIITAQKDIHVGAGVSAVGVITGRYLNPSSVTTQNVIIGWESSARNVTGSWNVLLGRRAGESLTSAGSAVCIGANAGQLLGGTTGVFIGGQCGARVTGGGNVFMGQNAGSYTTSATSCTIIGTYAGIDNQGSENTIVGYYAGRGNSGVTDGTRNTFIGTKSGFKIQGGDDNTGLGRDSLVELLGGNKNVAIGQQAGDALVSGNNNIIIGYQADASTSTTSNEITLGDANINHIRIPGIGVSFNNTGGTQLGIITATELDISGDIDVDGHTNLDNVSIAGVVTATSFATDGGHMYITNAMPALYLTDTNNNPDWRIQNVNGTLSFIDATNSVHRIEINTVGNVSLSNDLDVDGHTNLDNVSIAGVVTATTFVGNLTGDVTGDVTGAATRVTVTNQAGDSTCNILFTQSATGNQLPHTNANLTFNATNGRLTATSFAGDGSNLTGIISDKIFEGNTEVETVDTGSNGHIKFTTEGTERLRITNVGSLGIGTDNPQHQLDLYDIQASSSGTAPVLCIRNGYAGIPDQSNALKSEIRFLHRNHNSAHDFMATRIICETTDNYMQRTHLRFLVANANNGTERLTLNPYGNIGINQDTPTANLEVCPSDSATDTATIFINAENHDTNVASEAILKFGYGHSGNPDGVGYIKLVEDATNSFDADFRIGLPTNNQSGGSVTNERVRITSEGSVNIGGDYTQSTYKLKVTGSFAATTKSFVIDHPTKENHSLRYACLEGPENSVYVRGKTSESVIELPEYWKGLVHEDSITVNVTPIGNHKVWVETINNNSVIIGSDGTEYFYTVFAERKDVDKLEVEVAK